MPYYAEISMLLAVKIGFQPRNFHGADIGFCIGHSAVGVILNFFIERIERQHPVAPRLCILQIFKAYIIIIRKIHTWLHGNAGLTAWGEYIAFLQHFFRFFQRKQFYLATGYVSAIRRCDLLAIANLHADPIICARPYSLIITIINGNYDCI